MTFNNDDVFHYHINDNHSYGPYRKDNSLSDDLLIKQKQYNNIDYGEDLTSNLNTLGSNSVGGNPALLAALPALLPTLVKEGFGLVNKIFPSKTEKESRQHELEKIKQAQEIEQRKLKATEDLLAQSIRNNSEIREYYKELLKSTSDPKERLEILKNMSNLKN